MRISELTEDLLAGELINMPAEELIEWALKNFGQRAAIGTSFQLTGSVMIDIASRVSKDSFRVFTVDTLRLHPETYDTILRVEERYGIKVERCRPDPKRLKDMLEKYGEYLFFTGKVEQEFCCYVRKVEPNERALETLDVWMTGLRRDQSEHRKDVEKAELVSLGERRILKLAPLADWDIERIWRYIKENDVPYNQLFDRGYDSVGCIICSTPLLEGEPSRSGRWRWFNRSDDRKECGIHIPKGGTSI